MLNFKTLYYNAFPFNLIEEFMSTFNNKEEVSSDTIENLVAELIKIIMNHVIKLKGLGNGDEYFIILTASLQKLISDVTKMLLPDKQECLDYIDFICFESKYLLGKTNGHH